MNKKIFLLFIILISLNGSAFAYDGNKSVASAGTREAIVSVDVPFTDASICAKSDNTGTISIGGVGVVASLATRTGIPLDANDCWSPNASGRTRNLRNYYIDSTVSGDSVTFFAE